MERITLTSTLKVEEGERTRIAGPLIYHPAKAAISKKLFYRRKKPNYGASNTAVGGLASNPASARTQ